jgi:hypothetical protein
MIDIFFFFSGATLYNCHGSGLLIISSVIALIQPMNLISSDTAKYFYFIKEAKVLENLDFWRPNLDPGNGDLAGLDRLTRRIVRNNGPGSSS